MPTKKELIAENERLTKVLEQIQAEFRMFNNSDMPDGRGCDGNLHKVQYRT